MWLCVSDQRSRSCYTDKLVFAICSQTNAAVQKRVGGCGGLTDQVDA